MARINSKPKRALVLLLTIVMFITGFGTVGNTNASASDNTGVELPESMIRTDLTDMKVEASSITYSEYLALHEGTKDASESSYVTDLISGINADSTTAFYQMLSEFSDDSGNVISNVLVLGDDGEITFDVEVKETAYYTIEIGYNTGSLYIYTCTGDECGHTEICANEKYSVDDPICPKCSAKMNVIFAKNSAIERKIKIDGTIPFKEARSVELQRSWVDHYTQTEIVDNNGKLEEVTVSDIISANKEYYTTVGDNNRYFLTDGSGNEKKPEKLMYSEWATSMLYDSTGYASEPLKFYLEAGKHTITLEAIREPVVISSISLKSYEAPISYEEYLNKYSAYGDVSKDVSVKVQAEYAIKTSSKTIYQTSDRTSSLSEPQDVSKTVLNEIGGDKWQYVGQWIEWYVEVPETGFYKIIPRSIQDFYSGVYVSRKIYIDGETPFAEAARLRFNYTDDWQTKTLTDGNTDFKFFLEAGSHVIRLEVVLGEMAEVLSSVENSLNNINAYYRKILMITGPDPDEYRDYSFDRTLPDVIRGLRKEAQNLENVSNKLSEIIGYKGDHSITLDKVAYTVGQMGNYPSKIASLMDDLKTQTGSLGTWLTQTQNQPLNIDYILFTSPENSNPKAEAGFFKELWTEILKFIYSFFTDYNSISSTSKLNNAANADAAHTVEVWVTTGRDQASILRNLVDDSFSNKYPGINVKVKLVAAGTLLPSTLAGSGPDVSLGNAQTEAINYAIRSAVKALNIKSDENGNPINDNGYDFNNLDRYADDPIYGNADYNYYTVNEDGSLNWNVDTFDEVVERFADGAIGPLTLYGETYGLPENMTCYMMFYRKDILADLDLAVPNTWDDFYDMIYTLQSNKLEIGFPTGVTGSTIWMYQQGETMYDMGNYDAYMEKYGDILIEQGNVYYDDEGNLIPKTDGMTINLDSDIALACFKNVCQLYTMYDFPVTYDFANRFRSGEMPIAVADYTAYNQLIVFAPEINGMWEFTPLPGTADVNGYINNTSVGTVTAMMMMRSVEDRGNEFAAYVFMQWWSDADSQSSYGNEMEALLGPSAKQNTANVEALYSMPWSKSEYDQLSAQFKNMTFTPEFPGGYIIARYAQFAFLGVYNDGDEPVEKLQSYITTINAELSRKRQEFDLPIAEDFPLDEE